mgnify:CR=1 FL=1
MKKRILIAACIIICIVAFLLIRLNWQPEAYPFPNKNVEIKKVELLRNLNSEGYGILEENFLLLAELDTDEINTFMTDIYELETNRRNGGPLWGYGEFFARVTYANTDVEYLGIGNIELVSNDHHDGISSGSQQSGFGSYYFSPDEFLSIFVKYADIP